MNLKVVSKNKNGELNINFSLVMMLFIMFGFIFGIGFNLSNKLINLIIGYITGNQIFIYERIFPTIEIVFLLTLVFIIAKLTDKLTRK